MKVQKCYSLDSRVAEAVQLYQNEKRKPNSYWVEQATVEFLERKADEVQDANLRASIVNRLEAYRDAEG